MTGVGQESLQLRDPLLQGVVLSQEDHKLVLGRLPSTRGSADATRAAQETLQLCRCGVVELAHPAAVTLVLDKLATHVPGEVADVYVARAWRETEVIGEGPRTQEVLLVLSLGVDQLAAVASAALLLEVAAEDGATQRDTLVERINFGGVFEVTAGPTDTLAAQKVDAQLREQELLTIAGIDAWRKEAQFQK